MTSAAGAVGTAETVGEVDAGRGVDDGGEVDARARVRRHDGRLTWASCPPIVLRRTGRDRVHLVAVGGGPLGGDRLGLDVDLGPGEHLAVRSAAATVVQPGRHGGAATYGVRARLAAGASLDWRPEPAVITDGADWRPRLDLDLADGARALVVDVVVLGRSGQRGGRCRSDLRVTVGGRPLLVTSTLLDGADPGFAGPGGTGGSRCVGTVLGVGDGAGPDEDAGQEPDVVWARSPLAGPGWLLTAVGTVRGVRRVLDEAVGAR